MSGNIDVDESRLSISILADIRVDLSNNASVCNKRYLQNGLRVSDATLNRLSVAVFIYQMASNATEDRRSIRVSSHVVPVFPDEASQRSGMHDGSL
ncbi:hypothetical protein DICVIV_02608 [Dictyocaulus viviparus]|uniref:Uncharacterized protein n=1 Tax=Dictyocaulus viviparus TaxID=29172 RepID=A0A0D8Y322_DICVI|nr:hypothetical protein DICVIV_02608 [Dictyocaulus viviparus]